MNSLHYKNPSTKFLIKEFRPKPFKNLKMMLSLLSQYDLQGLSYGTTDLEEALMFQKDDLNEYLESAGILNDKFVSQSEAKKLKLLLSWLNQYGLQGLFYETTDLKTLLLHKGYLNDYLKTLKKPLISENYLMASIQEALQSQINPSFKLKPKESAAYQEKKSSLEESSNPKELRNKKPSSGMSFFDSPPSQPSVQSLSKFYETQAKRIIEAAANNWVDTIRTHFASDLYLKRIDDRDQLGNTALISAAVHGHEEIVQMLLEYGANPYIGNHSTATAEEQAKSKGFLNIVKRIRSYTLLKAVTRYDLPAVRHYIEAHPQDLQAINITDEFNYIDDNGNTALILAAKIGLHLMIPLLLEAGADKDLKNKDQKTAEQVALAHGHDDIADFIAAQDPLKRRRASGNFDTRTEGIDFEQCAIGNPTELGYICPISLTLMDDPVTVVFDPHLPGITYNRQSLEQLFEFEQNSRQLEYPPAYIRCPMTKQMIPFSCLVQDKNRKLHEEILVFVENVELLHEMQQARLKRQSPSENKLKYKAQPPEAKPNYFNQAMIVQQFLSAIQEEEKKPSGVYTTPQRMVYTFKHQEKTIRLNRFFSEKPLEGPKEEKDVFEQAIENPSPKIRFYLQKLCETIKSPSYTLGLIRT